MLFSILVAVAVGAAILLLPGLAAASLAVEHEQNTHDLLQMTLIRPRGIVLAKLANVLGLYFLWCVAALPVLGLVLFLVGVDRVEVARAIAAVFLNALMCAAIGLLYGSLFRKTAHAVAYAYLGVLLFYLLGMSGLMCAGTYGIPPPVRLRVSDLASLYFATVAIACLVGAARYLPRHKRTPPALTHRSFIDDRALLDARRRRFPYYLLDPLRRKPGISDRWNPMLVKELRWGLITRANVSIRILYTTVIIATALNLATVWPGLYVGIGNAVEGLLALMLAQSGLAVLAVPLLMSNAFLKEREGGNVDLLRATLLTPRQIVLGKLAAGLVALSPLLLAVTLAGLPVIAIAAIYSRGLAVFLAGYPTLYVSVWLAACLTLRVSVWAKRAAVSLVVSYVLVVAVLGGLYWIIVLVVIPEIWGPGLSERAIESSVVYWSPFWAYGWTFALTAAGSIEITRWLASLGLYAAFGLLLVALSVRHFRLKHMRDR